MSLLNKTLLFAISFVFAVAGFAVLKTSGATAATSSAQATAKAPVPADASVAYFASGCFWCVEAVYESVEGVYEAESGYSGGTEQNPSYDAVARGQTSHAEAVKVYYDPNKVTYKTLVDVFFGSQDPTQVNGQGPDRGTQYRSSIFYTSDEEKAIAQKAKADLGASGEYKAPIAAEIVAFEKWWIAEDYHQDYERKNPRNPYVRAVSIPRLRKFQAKFPSILKKDHS